MDPVCSQSRTLPPPFPGYDSAPNPHDWQIRWLHILGWMAFAAAMFMWGLQYWTVVDAIVNKLLLFATAVGISALLRLLYRFLRCRHARMAVCGATVLVASFTAGVLWFELESLLFNVYLTTKIPALSIRLAPIPIGLFLFYGFVMLAWSALYFAIHGWLDADANWRRAVRAEGLAHQAHLLALRSQLEPHFLFNTLNSISTLIAENRNEAANAMLAKLSDFLRLTLEGRTGTRFL